MTYECRTNQYGRPPGCFQPYNTPQYNTPLYNTPQVEEDQWCAIL